MRKISVLFACLLIVLSIFSLTSRNASAHPTSGGNIPPTRSTILRLAAPSSARSTIQPNISGNGYNGLFPDKTGCWDSSAYVVTETTGTYAGRSILIAMWYSPTCQTNWGDFQITSGAPYQYLNAQVTRLAGPDGGELGVGDDTNPGPVYRNWSAMVYSPHNASRGEGYWYYNDILNTKYI